MRPWLETIWSAAWLTSALFADVKRDGLGLAPFFVMFATTRSSSCLRRPENHDDPAVRREIFRSGLADSAAAAGSPRPRVSRYLSCKLSPLLFEGRFC